MHATVTYSIPSTTHPVNLHLYAFASSPSVRSPSVCPSVNTFFARRGISLLNGEISMKLAVNIHHANGHCWTGF